LKYPANPPTVGDAETVVLRSILYLSFIAISGFGAVGFYQLYKRLQTKSKIAAFVGYAVFIVVVFALMPPNPDEVTAPMDLVNGFRAMSVVAVSVFWVSLAAILGMFWNKFRPDTQITVAKTSFGE
jgi:predicted cobalt transporter CbtA